MAWFKRRPKNAPIDPVELRNRFIYYLGQTLDAGVVVDRETAMQISTVCACCVILAQDVGKVPLGVFQTKKNGPDGASWTREGQLCQLGPNGWQTTQDWQEQIVLNVLTYGDYYARIFRVGEPPIWDSLMPLDDPSRIETTIVAGKKQHAVLDQYGNATGQVFGQDDIFHVHGPSIDGISGRDFTDIHRQTLSLSKAILRYGANWFANGAVPGLVLILPPGTKAEDIPAAKQAFRDNFGNNNDNVHSIAAFSNGTQVHPVGVNPENSQMLETRQQANKEIAPLFNMPLWRLYQENAPTAEARMSYYSDTLGPWFVRIATNATKQLIANAPTFYAKHQTGALLAADIKTRAQAYAMGIASRWMNPNEARRFEDMPSYEGGDQFINPAVMSAVDAQIAEDKRASI